MCHKYQWATTVTTCVDRRWPHALQELNLKIYHTLLLLLLLLNMEQHIKFRSSLIMYYKLQERFS